MTIYQYREMKLPYKHEGSDFLYFNATVNLGLWDSDRDVSIYDFRCLNQEAIYLLTDRLKGNRNNREWDVIHIGRTDNLLYEGGRLVHTGLLSAGLSLSPTPLTLSEIVQMREKQKTLSVYRRWDNETDPFSAVYIEEYKPIIGHQEAYTPQEIFNKLLGLAEFVVKNDRMMANPPKLTRLSNQIKRFLACHLFTDDPVKLLKAARP